MLYEEFIIERVFNDSQIKDLVDVYRESVVEYLNDLDYDPFCYDNTKVNLSEKIMEILPDVVFDTNDLKDLVNIFYNYCSTKI